MNAIRKYVDSCNNPSIGDKWKMWKAKRIEKLVYGSIPKPEMFIEKFSDIPVYYKVEVKSGYELYKDKIFNDCKINFLKLMNVNEDSFRFEEEL